MNRRDFLKTNLLGFGALSLGPAKLSSILPGVIRTGRITSASVSIYTEAWDKSKIAYTRYRDDVVNLYYQVVSEKGPDWNPIWYRVWGGYIHSKFLQVVENQPNNVLPAVRKEGQLAEVSIPFVQTMRFQGKDKWEPLYRLYYGSVHWVINVIEGPDRETWYRLQEPWSQLTYDVTGKAMRLIADDELLPISPEVPAQDKKIEVSLLRQELTAYEKGSPVFHTKVSTGLNRLVADGLIPWKTPLGSWAITSKMPSQHMGEGNITSDVEAYELTGVPWVCYFHVNGNATHGTYWHTNYGNTMSHGCVNMRIEDARWVFLWTYPVWSPTERDKKGNGTSITVTP